MKNGIKKKQKQEVIEHPHCYICGSEDVRMDGLLSWNKNTMQWEICTIFDNASCEGCGLDVKLEWK